VLTLAVAVGLGVALLIGGAKVLIDLLAVANTPRLPGEPWEEW
jgi:hypothetical protein